MPVAEATLIDLRIATRQLCKTPGFTLFVIAILGFGLGANAAIFSVVNALLLNAAPYPEASKLVVLFEHDINPGSGRASISYLDYQDWQAQSHTLERLAISSEVRFNLSGGNSLDSVRIDGAICSPSLFEALGVQPLLGRFLIASDDQPGSAAVAVIGYSLWQSRFGGAADILTRRLHLNGADYAITGVMPKGFGYPHNRSQVWIAAAPAMSGEARTRRGWRQFQGLGRLAPGMSIDQARLELSAIARRIKQISPACHSPRRLRCCPCGSSWHMTSVRRFSCCSVR